MCYMSRAQNLILLHVLGLELSSLCGQIKGMDLLERLLFTNMRMYAVITESVRHVMSRLS